VYLIQVHLQNPESPKLLGSVNFTCKTPRARTLARSPYLRALHARSAKPRQPMGLPDTGRGGAEVGATDQQVNRTLLPITSNSVLRTLEPEWNRTLVFLNIPRDELPEKGVEFTVWDHDRFMPNQCLGEVVLDLAGKSPRNSVQLLYHLLLRNIISNSLKSIPNENATTKVLHDASQNSFYSYLGAVTSFASLSLMGPEIAETKTCVISRQHVRDRHVKI
jgi:hypothetical protein